jgi:outer membrane receptor protein involved in Fe transport
MSILRRATHADTSASRIPRVPGRRRPELEPLELEHPGTVHHREEPGQPVRDRLHGVSRVLLHRDYADLVLRCARRRSGRVLVEHRRFATTSNNDITTPTASRAPQERINPTIDVSDTLTWLKGSHNLSIGGSFTHVGLWAYNQNVVPQVNLGIVTGDPADAMFNTTNFPNASSTNLADARALYSVLTGRVSSINADARLDETTGKYAYLAPGVQRGQLHELGGFIQDQWRARENLTINAGLRYEYQFPFVSRNDSYATATVPDIWGVSGVGNLFKPGTLTGQVSQYQNLTRTRTPTRRT